MPRQSGEVCPFRALDASEWWTQDWRRCRQEDIVAEWGYSDRRCQSDDGERAAMVVMVVRLIPRVCESAVVGLRIVMVIRVMPDVHDIRTFFMVCAVHSRCRPGGLQRHEHDEEDKQAATHY